ncbi:MAG: DUF5979 domain-containing protein [Clostridiales bacterium]|nr:DUF5979 domain-containing protein [Clostridiales bacterium]
MSENKVRGRSRKKKVTMASRIYAEMMKAKRLISAAVCISMLGSSVVNPAMLTYADSEEEVQEFELESEALREAVTEAIADGSLISAEDLGFSGAEEDTYAELFDADGLLYEVKPEIEDTRDADGNLDLRIFVRLDVVDLLDEGETLDSYEITGDEDVFFMLVNNTDIEQNAIVIVDGRETDVITVAPQSAVDGALDDEEASIEGGGAADVSDQEAEEELVDDVSADADESEDVYTETENGEESDSDEIVIDVTDSVSDMDDEQKTADSDSDRMAEGNTETEDTQDFDDADENPDTTGDVDGDDDSDTTEVADSDSQSDDEDKTENDSDPADDVSDDSKDSDSDKDTDSGSDDSSDASDRSDDSEKDSNDKSNDKSDDKDDDSDKENVDARSASISVHSYNLVTLAASPTDAEETEEVLSVSEDNNQLDGELYDAVAMEDGAAVVFVTTTGELGLEGVISSGDDTVYTVETETAVITAVVPDGAFEEEVYLYAEEITESSETWQQVTEIWEGKAAQEGVSAADSAFVAYDICFKNAADEEVEPEAGANISISIRFIDGSVLTGYDETADNLSLLHISDDGEVEEVEAITTADDADGVDTIEYEVSSFSLMLMGIMSVAAEAEIVAQIGETTYETVTSALEAVTDSTETTITMLADSTEDITVDSSQVIILDLNGCTLTGTGSGSVITNSGTLTLMDGSEGGTGTVTGGSAARGGGVYSTGSLKLASGTITGNTATSTGGGVYSTGEFTFTGGTITENTATSSGGGVYASGTKTITGGSVTNNTSGNQGGGLYISGEITIMGTGNNPVVISGNTATNGGGGAYISSPSAAVSLTYLTVSDNMVTGTPVSAQYYYYAAGLTIIGDRTTAGNKVTLDYVTISNNESETATTGGLGVYASWFTATNCEITGNTSASGVGGVHTYTSNPSLKDAQKIYSYNFDFCVISNNEGGTVGGLFVERYSTATAYYANAVLTDTVITGNTGVTAGGASGALNMTSGALYGNASTDGNAANDWLVTKAVVTAASFNVSVLSASSMSDGSTSFDGYMWRDFVNVLNLDSVLNSSTLSSKNADTFYFTAGTIRYVAEVTIDGVTTQYEAITDAIEAVINSEEADLVIKLIAGESDNSGYTIVEDVTIPEDASIIIDLNGHTISSKSANYAVTLSSGSSLTLNGDGTVESIDHQGQSLSILGDTQVDTIRLADGNSIEASASFEPEGLTIVLASTVLATLQNPENATSVILVIPASGETLSDTLAGSITISGASSSLVYVENDNSNVVAKTINISGIFVDGVNGSNETGDGSYANPVKTFSKAKELLAEALEAGKDVDGIYVINTITVNDTEEWSLDDLTDEAGEVALMRFPTFTGVLAVIGDSGNLTLSDITIDGQNITVKSSLIQVYGENAELTIKDGTVIQNNVNAVSGQISETEAAVTVVNGTLTMNGGTVTGNAGNWGGGIALVANDDSKEAVMYFNGGTISYNTADIGGGVFLYGNATLYMNGGYIDSNTAYSRGGGLAVWSGADAYIYGGYITNNQQVTDSAANETSYGGGGIYVNDSSGSFGYGTLYLYNVKITDNSHVQSQSTSNDYYDGTIAACNTSSIEIYVTDGAVIYDNHAWQYRDITLYSDSYQENFTLTPVMLGGGAYNWVDRSGNVVDVTNLSQYRGGQTGLAFRSTATEITGLDRVTTYITGNSAIRTGAAIAINGNLVIGRDDGMVTLNIEKVWGNAFDESSIPESIEVELYATDSKGVTADLGTLTLTAENDWTVTVTDLPKYDSYYDSDTQTSGTYTYTIGEVSDEYFSVVTYEEVDDEDNDILTATYEITVTNLPKAELELQKVVEGKTTASDFEFTITLLCDDEPYSGIVAATVSDAEANKSSGSVEFTDGTATVTLNAGEMLTLALGAGMTYTVKETDSQGASKVQVNDTEGNSTGGTLTTDGTSIVVTNTYTGDEPTVGTGDLTVSKIVTGTGADTTKAFTFTVTLDDTDINGTYGNMTFVNGVAFFTLAHGQSKTAEDLPENVGYVVTEEAANDYTSSSENETGTIESDVVKNVVFTNTYTSDDGEEPETGTGTLTVSKTVTGSGSKTKEFTFTVTLSDTSINGTYGDMTFVNGVATFTLTHGESKTAEGLPEGITYTVTESSTSGYRTTSEGATGTIESGGVATVAFTNKKTSSGGGGGGSSSGSSTSGTTAGSTSGPGVSSGDAGTSDPGDPGTPASPSSADPLTGLPKTGDNTSSTATFTFLFGMVAVAYVILSDKKKEKVNKN